MVGENLPKNSLLLLSKRINQFRGTLVNMKKYIRMVPSSFDSLRIILFVYEREIYVEKRRNETDKGTIGFFEI